MKVKNWKPVFDFKNSNKLETHGFKYLKSDIFEYYKNVKQYLRKEKNLEKYDD